MFTDLNENDALVIHHGFGDYLRPVAKITLPEGVDETAGLDYIFKKTNTIDSFWTDNEDVVLSDSVTASGGARSTSVGDLIYFQGQFHLVEGVGFSRVHPADIVRDIDKDIESVEALKSFFDDHHGIVDKVAFDLDTRKGADKHRLTLESGGKRITVGLEPNIFKNLNRVANHGDTIIPHLKDTVEGVTFIQSKTMKKALTP